MTKTQKQQSDSQGRRKDGARSSSARGKGKGKGTTPRTSSAPSSSAATAAAARLQAILRMALCITGIYAGFTMWSLKQEQVIKKPYVTNGVKEFFPSNFILVLGQCALAAGIAAVLAIVEKAVSVAASTPGQQAAAVKKEGHACKGSRRAMLKVLVTMSFGIAFVGTLSYVAMRLVPFPVFLAAKMCKMLPVMVIGFLVHGIRYPRKKVLSCAFITAGILLYVGTSSEGKRKSDPAGAHATAAAAAVVVQWVPAYLAPVVELVYSQLGLLIVFVTLVMDGYAYSAQDVLVKAYRWSSTKLMLWSNVCACLWIAALLALTEEKPWATVMHLVALALPTEVAGKNGRNLAWTTAYIPYRELSVTREFFQRHPQAVNDILVMSLCNAVGQVFIFLTVGWFGAVTLTAITLARKCGSVILSIVVHGHAIGLGQVVALAVMYAGVLWEGQQSIVEASAKAKAKAASAAEKTKKE